MPTPEDVAIDTAKESRELRNKFFLRWFVLSAGTFTLLVPFTQDIFNKKEIVEGYCSIKIGAILILVSLICSSLRLLFSSRTLWYTALENAEQRTHTRVKLWGKLVLITDYSAIITYIVGISFVLYFLDKNIFS